MDDVEFALTQKTLQLQVAVTERDVANEAAALTAGGHHVRTHVVSNPTALPAAMRALAKSFDNRGAAKFVAGK